MATLRDRLPPIFGAAVLALLALGLPAGSFYSTDGGVNYLMARTLARGGTVGAVELPEGPPSANGELHPLKGTSEGPPPHNFLARLGEHWTITYPPLFAILSSLFLVLGGAAGLVVLPWMGAVGAALAASSIFAGHDPPRAAWYALILLWATPLAFYGVLFWGHAPAAALVLVAFQAMVRGRPLLAGMLVALAAPLRTEALAAVGILPVVGLAGPDSRSFSVLSARLLHFTLGAALVFLPWAGANLTLYGNVRGLHIEKTLPVLKGQVSRPDRPTWTAHTARNLFLFLGENHRMSSGTKTLLLGGLLSGVAAAAVPAGTLRGVFLLAAALAGVGLLLFNVLVPGQYAPGLLMTCPLAVLFPLGARVSFRDNRRVVFCTVAFVLLNLVAVCALAPRGGWQWGPRYLLPVIPLVAGLALAAKRAAPRTTLVLIVCSVGLQLGAFRDLSNQLSSQSELLQGLTPGQALVTDVWFLPWQLLPGLFDREIAHFRGPGALPRVAEWLQAEGLHSARFLSGRYRGQNAIQYRKAAAELGLSLDKERVVRFPSGDRVTILTLHWGKTDAREPHNRASPSE